MKKAHNPEFIGRDEIERRKMLNEKRVADASERGALATESLSTEARAANERAELAEQKSASASLRAWLSFGVSVVSLIVAILALLKP